MVLRPSEAKTLASKLGETKILASRLRPEDRGRGQCYDAKAKQGRGQRFGLYFEAEAQILARGQVTPKRRPLSQTRPKFWPQGRGQKLLKQFLKVLTV